MYEQNRDDYESLSGTIEIPQEHDPVISQEFKWTTVAGNAVIGAAELLTGNVSTLSVTTDGLHNVGDTASYYIQAENILNTSYSEEKRHRLRKAAYWIIATTSVIAGVRAGVDLSLNHEGTPHEGALYTASASLALSGIMLARLRRQQSKKDHQTVHEQDLSKHFWQIDIPSAGLATMGAILQKYNVDIEQTIATASGAWGVWVFRPTKANLSHSCHGHGHGHIKEHAPIGPKKKEKRNVEKTPSRWRRTLSRGAAALAVVAAMLSGDAHETGVKPVAPEQTYAFDDGHTGFAEDVGPPTRRHPTSECAVVKKGDSGWNIIEQETRAINGIGPSVAVTNAITMFTVIKNKRTNGNPELIKVSDCLQVPTSKALHIMRTALERPAASSPQLVADLLTLNSQASIAEVLQKDAEYNRIELHLQKELNLNSAI